MTNSQIQYFLAAAEEKSISKAAESMYVSQPAVSKQLSLLEEELGVSLFKRKSHGIEITDAGKEFEALFLEYRLRFNETLERAKKLQQDLSGIYRLGCLEGWDISTFFPDLSSVVSGKYPEIELQVSGYNLDQMIYALRKGEIDGAIGIESVLSSYPEFATRHISELDGLLIYSRKHHLAGKKDLKLSDFLDSTFYVTAPLGMKAATTELVSICKAWGFVPKLEYLPTLSAAFMKLQYGKGVLLSNEWMMARGNPLFEVLPLDFKRNICIATRKNAPSEATEIISREIVSFFTEGAETV